MRFIVLASSVLSLRGLFRGTKHRLDSIERILETLSENVGELSQALVVVDEKVDSIIEKLEEPVVEEPVVEEPVVPIL